MEYNSVQRNISATAVNERFLSFSIRLCLYHMGSDE